MEDINTNLNSDFSDSGAGQWSSGLNESGTGIVKNRSFWLVADAELIVYGATIHLQLTIGNEEVPLAADGTFRLQVPFRDGSQNMKLKLSMLLGNKKKVLQ